MRLPKRQLKYPKHLLQTETTELAEEVNVAVRDLCFEVSGVRLEDVACCVTYAFVALASSIGVFE